MKTLAASLEATFSPSAYKMSQVDPQDAKIALEAAFRQWGRPLRVRFDNGPPFANTIDRHLPTALAVWLASLHIEVIFNRVNSPQQNGSVECTQRISSRWANCHKCKTPQELQEALDIVSHEHIHVYRQRHNGDRTRAVAYPDLLNNPRKYDPKAIDPEHARKYLLQMRLTRKIFGNGCISIHGSILSVGRKYKHQQVEVSLDPQATCWQVTLSSSGKIIKKLSQLDLRKKAISQLTVFSKNFTT